MIPGCASDVFPKFEVGNFNILSGIPGSEQHELHVYSRTYVFKGHELVASGLHRYQVSSARGCSQHHLMGICGIITIATKGHHEHRRRYDIQ